LLKLLFDRRTTHIAMSVDRLKSDTDVGETVKVQHRR